MMSEQTISEADAYEAARRDYLARQSDIKRIEGQCLALAIEMRSLARRLEHAERRLDNLERDGNSERAG